MSPSSRDTARMALARASPGIGEVAWTKATGAAGGLALGAALSMGGIAEVAGRLTASG